MPAHFESFSVGLMIVGDHWFGEDEYPYQFDLCSGCTIPSTRSALEAVNLLETFRRSAVSAFRELLTTHQRRGRGFETVLDAEFTGQFGDGPPLGKLRMTFAPNPSSWILAWDCGERREQKQIERKELDELLRFAKSIIDEESGRWMSFQEFDAAAPAEASPRSRHDRTSSSPPPADRKPRS